MSKLQNFNYQILGKESGPKLIFLHGLMGNLANWRKITSKFVDRYHIFIFDQRGHGRSFHPQGEYSPETYAEDLKDLVDELGWSEFSLVGHSMGGRNAINFSSRWPERVKKLVIEDIAPVFSSKAVDRIKRLLNLVPTPFESRAKARHFFQKEFAQLIKEEPQPEILSQYFYTNIVENSQGQANWRFSRQGVIASVEAGRALSRWDEVESLEVPALLIKGENSEELNNENFDKMLRCNSHIRGVVIKGAGHWVHNDNPQEFCRVIKEFFEKSES